MTTSLKPLVSMRCVPCEEGTSPLHGGSLAELKSRLGSNWTVINEHHLEKTYKLKNFRESLDFTNAVGEIAEQEGHHPEITLTWGRVTVRIWTHKVDGLTENDFVLAAKAEQAFARKGKGGTMKVKANERGHRRGVGEVRTRSYTYAAWRHKGGRIETASSHFRDRMLRKSSGGKW